MATLRRLFPALYLLINGGLYVVLAWLFVSDPQPWFERLSITLSEPAGYTELKAMYVGMMGSLGVFFLLGTLLGPWRRPALWLALLSYALLALARSWGIWIDGLANDFIRQLLAIEVAGVVLAMLALDCQRRLDRQPKNPYF